MSFAARDAGLAQWPRGQVMSFAGGGVLLAAPETYCFDRRSSTADESGGFALMAPCSRLNRNRWFGSRNAAVLTASIGPAKQDATAPQAADIVAMFPGARLLETRDDQLLPLVRLEFPEAVAEGASPVHWRGAFVLDRHLVALALYAPEGSRALGRQGAALLNELTHRTLEASTLPDLEAAGAVLPQAPRQSLRPLARPAAAAAAAPETAATPARRKKRGLGQRIAGLFQ
ncbi:hypothetical protein [Leisingera methylohalidivorans]|nr:hypothetical protein [Leisingera methylohalidivorans]